MAKKPKTTKPAANKKTSPKKTSAQKPPAKKTTGKKTDAAKPTGKTAKITRNKIPILLPPDDLPLSDVWFYSAEVEQMLKVKSRTINRWCNKGILVKHNWLGTIRFNKAYVDWLIEYGGRRFSWILALAGSAMNFFQTPVTDTLLFCL
jgi:hypothetical protein